MQGAPRQLKQLRCAGVFTKLENEFAIIWFRLARHIPTLKIS
jgi:hypothetical protein